MNDFLNKLNTDGFIFKKCLSPIEDNLTLERYIQYISREIKNNIELKGEKLIYDCEEFNINNEILTHYHLLAGSFQAVAWYYESEFEGREFIFGTKEQVYKLKPKMGYICFFTPNNPKFIHGVLPMKTEGTNFVSIGFSSIVNDMNGNKDIFLDSINDEILTTHLEDLVI